MEHHQVRLEHIRKPLTSPSKLLLQVHDKRLRAILIVDGVTKLLEDTFKVSIEPCVLYQGEPYIYPMEISKYIRSKVIVQRDIRIEVPFSEFGAFETVLFARSWIAMDNVDETFRQLLSTKRKTIGQIIYDRGLAIEYRNLYYKKVKSWKIAAAFGTRKTQFIQRSRLIFHDKRPTILLHEFVPV